MADKPEPQEVMQRLGDDLRDAVVIAGDAVSKALMGLGSAVSGAGRGTLPAAAAQPAIPGDQVGVTVRLSNESEQATAPFELTPVDLMSPDGDSIPAAAVEVAPGPHVIGGSGSTTVAVTVSVPPETKPGVYSGRLQSPDVPVGNAQVVVQVGP